MSNRDYDKLGGVIGKGLIPIWGSFVPLTGAGTVVASNVRGFGFGYAPTNGVMKLKAQPQNNPTPLTTPGILYVSAGLYSVTLEDPYLDCVRFGCDLALPATGANLSAVPVEPIVGINTANTGPTFKILLQNAAGSPTEGATTQRVYFAMLMRNSTVGYQKP